MRLPWTLSLTIFFAFTTTAYAEVMTVGQFKKSCLTEEQLTQGKPTGEELVSSLSCYAYIDGVTDGLVVGMETSNGIKKFCLPSNGIKSGGNYKMIRDFISAKKYPDELPIRMAVFATYVNYFPCSQP